MLGIAQLSFESLVESETHCLGRHHSDAKRQHVVYIECQANCAPPCMIGLVFVGMSFVSMEAE